MTMPVTQRLIKLHEAHHSLEDYQGGVPRWCTGCGDNAILAAVQRLCRDEDLPPERTAFVSGIGCSSRFPHYMKTYGFHGIHGRAFPIAQGVKMSRPDLAVFVNTGDGDCCSIGAAHWIHAIRYNMNMTAILHDNHVYGLTKKQASPTSPLGLKSNTTPRGSVLEAMNPLTVTLGVTNVSFVAQAVDWIPDLLYDIIRKAYHHRGFSFVRIIQRCPEFLPKMFEPWLHDPGRTLLLSHADGLTFSPELSRTYKNQIEHDPSNIDRAREIASSEDPIPVGILYRNPSVPCYDDLRAVGPLRTAEQTRAGLESEFDKVTVWPEDETPARRVACMKTPTPTGSLRPERSASFGRPGRHQLIHSQSTHSPEFNEQLWTWPRDFRNNGCSSRRGGGSARASTPSTACACDPHFWRPTGTSRAFAMTFRWCWSTVVPTPAPFARCRRSSTKCCRKSRRAASTVSA